jgi:hypothetical protein
MSPHAKPVKRMRNAAPRPGICRSCPAEPATKAHGCDFTVPDPTATETSIMAARELAHFSIVRQGEDYLITIEDKDGETAEYTADYDALDVIAEAIEETLDSDEEDALAIDEDGEEAEEED